jgi:DNA-binding SARP family transcriptional activator
MTGHRGGWGARLTLLGGFGLYIGDDTVPLPPSPQRLIALVALHETALSRAYVAGRMWSDSTETHAHGSLRSALWKLQTTLPGVICVRGDSLMLPPDVEVDFRRATSLARALMSGRFDEQTVSALLEPRFSCELLPGWYDDWVLVERERHRQLTLHALESLCEHLTAIGRYGAATLAGLAAIDREPLRESAHRALIRVHLAEGNAGEAIRRYRLYEKIAARDLGVAPSVMMRSLLSDITSVLRHGGGDRLVTRL